MKTLSRRAASGGRFAVIARLGAPSSTRRAPARLRMDAPDVVLARGKIPGAAMSSIRDASIEPLPRSESVP